MGETVIYVKVIQLLHACCFDQGCGASILLNHEGSERVLQVANHWEVLKWSMTSKPRLRRHVPTQSLAPIFSPLQPEMPPSRLLLFIYIKFYQIFFSSGYILTHPPMHSCSPSRDRNGSDPGWNHDRYGPKSVFTIPVLEPCPDLIRNLYIVSNRHKLWKKKKRKLDPVIDLDQKYDVEWINIIR